MTRVVKVCRSCGREKLLTHHGVNCSVCLARIKRHGDAHQYAIRPNHLEPYLRIVQRVRERNVHLNWDAIHSRWDVVVNHAKDFLAEWRAGKAIISYHRSGAEAIVTLSEKVDAKDVIDTAIAMYLMDEFEPNRFQSFVAFKTQLVRAIRKLDKGNLTRHRSKHQQGQTSTLNELHPHSVEYIASLIVPTLGVVGAHVAKLERTKEEKEREEKNAMYAELDKLV